MEPSKVLRFLLLLLLLIAGLVALSQEKQPMIWMEATQTTKFSERFSSTLLFQRRVFVSKDNTHQHIYWASGNYRVKPSFTVGGGLIYFTYHRKVGEWYASVPEVRPFQFVSFSSRVGNARLSLRTMVEERYMSEVMDGEVLPREAFNTRYRFRLRGFISLTEWRDLELSNELFLNGNHQPGDTFGQNRAIGRFKYKKGTWELSSGYMHWLVNTNAGTEHRPSLLLGAAYKL